MFGFLRRVLDHLKKDTLFPVLPGKQTYTRNCSLRELYVPAPLLLFQNPWELFLHFTIQTTETHTKNLCPTLFSYKKWNRLKYIKLIILSLSPVSLEDGSPWAVPVSRGAMGPLPAGSILTLDHPQLPRTVHLGEFQSATTLHTQISSCNTWNVFQARKMWLEVFLQTHFDWNGLRGQSQKQILGWREDSSLSSGVALLCPLTTTAEGSMTVAGSGVNRVDPTLQSLPKKKKSTSDPVTWTPFLTHGE